MKKLFPLLIFLFALPVMAAAPVNVWEGDDLTNPTFYNDADNWSLAAVPVAGDSIVYNTGAVNCTINVSTAALQNIMSTTGYTGVIVSKTGCIVTTSGNINLLHTTTNGALFNDTVRITGIGKLTISSALASPPPTGQVFDFRGSIDTLNNNHATSNPGIILKNQGNDTLVTLVGGTRTQNIRNVYTSTTSTIIIPASSTAYTYLCVAPTSDTLRLASGTNIVGIGNIGVKLLGTSTTTAIAIPSLISTIPLVFYNQTGATGNMIINLLGQIWVSNLLAFNHVANCTLFINTNNFPIKASGDIALGCDVANSHFVLSGGTSACTTGTWSGATYNSGTKDMNFSAGATIVCTGTHFTNGSSSVSSSNLSTVYMTGTGAKDTINSNGKTFYSIVENKTAGTGLYLGDSLNITDDLTLTAGELNQNNQNIRVGGDFIYAAANTDSLILGDTVNLTGNGDFALRGSGKIIGANTNIWHAGTGNWDVDVVPFSLLDNCSLAYATKTITVTGVIGSNAQMNGKLAIGQGVLALEGRFYIKCDSANPISIAGTINGSQALGFVNGAAATVNIPAINMTGTNNFIEFSKTAATGVTWNQTGAITCPGIWYFYKNQASNGCNWVTNNNTITAIDIDIGNNTSGACSLFCGSSTITMPSGSGYRGDVFNGGPFYVGMQTSQWSCFNGWQWGSNTTVDSGTSTVTFNGTGSMSLRCNGRPFHNVILDGTGGTLTISTDSLRCNDLSVVNGSLNAVYRPMRIAGNISFSGHANMQQWGMVTMTSANKKFSITTTGSALGMASCTLSVQDHDTLYFDDSQYDQLLPIGRLIVGDGDTLMFTSGDSMTIAVVAAADWSGSTFRTTSAGNPVYISAPAGVTVTNMDVMDNFNRGTAITAIDVSNLNRGGNTGWNFSYVFDSTYRDSTSDTACLSLDSQQVFKRDTLQQDSISGTYNTTLNWTHVSRLYDTDTTGPAIDTTTDPAGDSISLTISACNGDTTARDTFYVHVAVEAIKAFINRISIGIGIGL